MFMILTKSIEDTIPFLLLYMREASDMATHCVPAFNPNIALTVRSLNCLNRINNRTRVFSYIPRQIGLKMIYPVIQIFINIWYWIRPPCIQLLWLWTVYYMWVLVLHFQYPVFVRLWIFSPDCRRGIFRCSFILTSDSMCIYFFTSFICKKMHSGRLRYAFSDVGSK